MQRKRDQYKANSNGKKSGGGGAQRKGNYGGSSNEVCRNFLRGYCKAGANCRRIHPAGGGNGNGKKVRPSSTAVGPW